MAGDPARSWAGGRLEPENLKPNERLLQLCDGLSLAMSSALIQARSGKTKGQGTDESELHHEPLSSWVRACHHSGHRS